MVLFGEILMLIGLSTNVFLSLIVGLCRELFDSRHDLSLVRRSGGWL